MENNHNTPLDEMLKQIQKVETPPFLFTRINQRIENKRAGRFSPGLSWSIGLAFIAIILANVIILKSTSNKTRNNNNIVNSMNLLPDHSLYNE